MDAHSDRRSGRLLHKVLHVMKRHTDNPTPRSATEARRLDAAPPDVGTAYHPGAHGPETWSQVGAVPVPKSHCRDHPVELPDSRAEPGGVPVYADPNMVSPAAAERMRPLFRTDR
jgi:hypothetical protein